MNIHFGLQLGGVALAAAMAVTVAGCTRPQEATATPAPVTTIGTGIDDSVVSARVKAALLADPTVKSYGFKVDTHRGEVQLSGFVADQAHVERAVEIARGVEGVRTVENRVSVKSADTTVGNKVDDGIVTTRVKAALLADASVKSLDIAVVTRKNEVQLSGFVDSQIQMDHAVEVAHAIEGVRTVSNQLSIKK
ncbi:MAG TPA: BON domain-containing protein [Burkholderiales bacterium]|nr:BON domain-containing protein [Burkholderiales bacterium]